jgi:hypothetical protein
VPIGQGTVGAQPAPPAPVAPPAEAPLPQQQEEGFEPPLYEVTEPPTSPRRKLFPIDQPREDIEKGGERRLQDWSVVIDPRTDRRYIVVHGMLVLREERLLGDNPILPDGSISQRRELLMLPKYEDDGVAIPEGEVTEPPTSPRRKLFPIDQPREERWQVPPIPDGYEVINGQLRLRE